MTDRRTADERNAEKTQKKPDLSVTQLVASGLATVIAAVGASRLGLAGTLIGAAFMSVVSTAGSVLMRHYMDRGRSQMLGPTPENGGALIEPKQPWATGDPAETRLDLLADPSVTRLDLAVTRLDGFPYAPPDRAGSGPPTRVLGKGGRRRWSWPSWKVLMAAAAAVFVVSVGGMMVTQAVSGKPPSAWPGGGGGHAANLLPGSDTQPNDQPPAPARSSDTSTTPPASDSPPATPGAGDFTPTPDPTTKPSGAPSPAPDPSTSGTNPPVPTAPVPDPRISGGRPVPGGQ